MASNVYFSDLRTDFGNNLIDKLKRVMKEAGIETIDFDGHYAAIKLHFGEPGNLAFLRPNWARCVAEEIKKLGGKPFLTDCNTLYVGGRKNAIDHMDSANMNGYTPLTTGCQIIIADGLKGTDDVEVPVDGKYVTEAKIGRAVMDADIFISLTHFIGHEGPLAVVFSLTGKAIGAVEVAGMGHMEAHGFDDLLILFLELAGKLGKVIFAEQLSLGLQCPDIRKAPPYLRLIDPFHMTVALHGLGHQFLLRHGLVSSDQIIGHLIYHMDRTGAGIQHDIVSI